MSKATERTPLHRFHSTTNHTWFWTE